MNYHEEPFLTEQLEKVKDDVKWKKARQEKVKNNILEAIKQTPKNTRINHGIRKKLAPAAALLVIIGLSVILFMNGNSTNYHTGLEKDGVSYNNAAQIPFQKIEYKITEKIQQDIKAITDSGFDLKLPTFSIAEDMEIISVTKREGKEERVEVNTLFSFQGNKQFLLRQELIGTHNQALIDQRYTEIQGDAREIIISQEHAEINGDPIEIIIKDDFAYLTKSEIGKSLYLLTEKFGYSLHSQDLSTEQMVMLMESMELEN